MQAIIAALVAVFLLDPLQAAIGKRLADAGVSRAEVDAVLSCVRTAAPTIIDKVTSQPAWAIGRVIEIWIGSTQPEMVLKEVAPGCSGTLDTARAWLRRQS
ncbi:hypothetical protein [Bosea sp. AS-1]|uniref:hypothetical protein n=1 Tax=Bosea sp. AS-1 TaxID=2015316 RepID=UPI000B771A1D|nr:hypothetical protein [Bosea sp. AS-1]